MHKHVGLFSASEEGDTLYKPETIHIIIEAMKVSLYLDEADLPTGTLFAGQSHIFTRYPAKTRKCPAILYKRRIKLH